MWVCKNCNSDNWDRDESCVKCCRPRRQAADNSKQQARMILVGGINNRRMYTRGENVIHIERTGGLGGDVFWSKIVPIESIIAVEVMAPMALSEGYIQLNLQNGRDGGLYTVYHSEDTVAFKGQGEYDHALELRAYIQNWQEEQKKKQAQQNQPTGTETPRFSIADELLKYKQLLDMGVITDEEFARKKNQLLN